MNKILASFLCLCSLSICVGAQEYFPDKQEISQTTASNLLELLQGNVSGLYVGHSEDNIWGLPEVNIRGIQSYRIDNQPLYIVDGVELNQNTERNLNAFWQYDGAEPIQAINPLAFLSPNDIESIEVLKDATATALYGSRGACGVVIIKTRKAADASFTSTISSNVGVNLLKDVPQFSHTHHVKLTGSNDHTGFYVSGNFRNLSGGLSGNKGITAGAIAGFDTSAGENMRFGLKTILYGGNLSSPIKGLTDYDDDNMGYRGLLSTYLHFNFKSFFVKLDAGADYYRADRGIWYGVGTEFGARTPEYPDGGAAAILTTNTLSYNAQFSAGYHTYVARNHLLRLNMIAKVYGDNNTFNTQNGRNFINHLLRAKGLNYKSSLPINQNSNFALFHPSATLTFAYDWTRGLGLSAFVDADATPHFIFKNTIAIYPSMTAYADLTKLFKINSNTLSTLKLSGGWAKSGKEMHIPYLWFNKTGIDDIPQFEKGTETFYQGRDYLSTSEWHVSGELGILNDRVKIAFTYYDRNAEDRFSLYNFGGDPIDNKGTIYLNYVDPVNVYDRKDIVKNRGYELDMSFDIIRKENVEWTISLNGSYNDTNYPIGRIVGYVNDIDGKLADQTGEGRITEEDRVVLGRTMPLSSGGLSTVLKIGDLHILSSLDAAFGHKRLASSAYEDGVFSSSDLISANYLRMNTLGVNYNFQLDKKWMKAIDVRLVARNPFIISAADALNYSSMIMGVTLTF